MSRYKSSPWMRIVHGSIGNRVAILFVLVLMSMKTTIAFAGIVAEATPVEGTVPIDATTSAVVPQRESETDQQKQRQAQFNWFLDWISPNDEANDYVCSADQVISDNCIYRNDGECDADGDDCEIGTDCIDCDPCRRYTSSCDECVNSVNGDEIRTSTNASCVWCIDSTGTGICSSTALAEVLPLICSPDGGLTNSTFYDTCTDVEPVAPISSITEVPAPTPAYTCDGTVDTCVGANNGYCDKNFFVCRGRNSDCVDCDPCQAYRFQGCEACTSAPEGCLWCPSDAICKSIGTTMPVDTKFSCADSDFISTCEPSTTAFFADSFYGSMEYLYDMVRVKPVWEAGYTGSGIGIRINDDGVDPNHPDFRSKFDAESSCQVYTPVELNKKYSHGTTCAALAAASADGSCSVGMAPGATISACRVISVETTPEVADDSYLYANMEKMHISSNSFGYPNCKQRETFGERRLQSCPFSSTSPNSPCVVNACSGVDWSNPILRDSCELAIARYCQLETQSDVQACTSLLNLYTKCYFGSQSKQQVDAYIKGITEGRDGKGIIYVNSAGNDFGFGAQANFAGNLNSRFVISVGAVGKDGVHSTFSQGGSALLVSAPGGDFDFYTNNLVAMAGGGCTEGGSGTSNACPVVSGILALVLQANNNLSWRDVQGIIASTSQQVKPDDPSWTTNSAGFHHSYVYGFGIVDATAAVNAARTWANFNSETEIIGKSGALNLTIPEFTGGAVVSSINISSSSTFVAESVIVSLDVAHSSRGHLEISLVSPQGTASILSPGGRPESAQLSEPWVIKTVRNWGESANGEWSLRLEDRSEGDSSTCVDVADWTLNLGNDTHPVEFGCFELAFTKVCADGALTRTFGAIFPGLDATDPIFTDVNNVSLFSACCVCGGGQPASPVADMLKSWQLAVYGHDGISVPASPGLEAPIVATNASVPTAGTTNDGFNSTVSPTEAPTGAAVNDDESSMTGTPTMAPSSLPSATEVSAGNGTDPTGFATNGSGPSVGSSNAPTGSLSPPDLSPGPPAPVGGTTSSVSSQSGGGWINSAGAWYFFVLAVIMF